MNPLYSLYEGSVLICDVGNEVAPARPLQGALHQAIHAIDDAVAGRIGADAQGFEESDQARDCRLGMRGIEDPQQQGIDLRILTEGKAHDVR